MLNTDMKKLTAGLYALAAVIMLAAPLVSSADEMFRKDGHEITCKVVANQNPLLRELIASIGEWTHFSLTIMHGEHLIYDCVGETITKTKRKHNKDRHYKELTGDYNCSRRTGILGIWRYPWSGGYIS